MNTYQFFNPLPEDDDPILPFTKRTALTGVLLALLFTLLCLFFTSCAGYRGSYNALYKHQLTTTKKAQKAFYNGNAAKRKTAW